MNLISNVCGPIPALTAAVVVLSTTGVLVSMAGQAIEGVPMITLELGPRADQLVDLSMQAAALLVTKMTEAIESASAIADGDCSLLTELPGQ